jgi:hypothetical protein
MIVAKKKKVHPVCDLESPLVTQSLHLLSTLHSNSMDTQLPLLVPHLTSLLSPLVHDDSAPAPPSPHSDPNDSMGMPSAFCLSLAQPSHVWSSCLSHQITALIWEFTGTFFLSFVITAGAHNRSYAHPLLPLAIGWILAIMVYAGAQISGKPAWPLQAAPFTSTHIQLFAHGDCPGRHWCHPIAPAILRFHLLTVRSHGHMQ